MNNFRELNVWVKAVDLATDIYKTNDLYPKQEIYGLTSQIRKCAISIGSNIAVGAGRRSKKEFSQFLDIASGSFYEMETQLIISRNLEYLSKEKSETHIKSLTEIQKMFYVLIKALH